MMLKLPERLRGDFAVPFGPVYRRIPEPDAGIACVGDVVSRSCADFGLENLLLVVDGITRREIRASPISQSGFSLHRAKNPRGSLSPSASRLICELIRSGGRHLVLVEGEEDMLALAAIACMRPGWAVTYGIPGRGACYVRHSDLAARVAQLRYLYLTPALV